MSRLSLEAQELLANMVINRREVDQLIAENTDELDAYFTLDLKNRVADLYENAHGKYKDSATAINNMLHWCSWKAYGEGYKAALLKYSEIIANEIERVSSL